MQILLHIPWPFSDVSYLISLKRQNLLQNLMGLSLPSPPSIQSVTKLTRKGFPGAGMLEDDKDIADKGQGLD